MDYAEYAENLVQLTMNLIALLLCLFHYISNKRRGWLAAIAFFLCSLLSCYFWTTYSIIMGEWPNGLDWLTYSGWNAAYLVLFLLLFLMKSPEERRYFHPVMLLPVPLNVWQLTLYLPYGSVLNNVYQVLIGTLLSCFSLQGILWYWKNRNNGAEKPYGCLSILLFITFEFGMWTSSSLDEPWSGLYYPVSFLCSLDYLLIVWAISRHYSAAGKTDTTSIDRKYQRILKISYLGILLGGSVGGVMLGVWIRNILTGHADPSSTAGAYDIIPVILFVISLIIVIFTIGVILIVYFGQKAAENSELREARNIAEHSNAAKSEFLANMSHEIRTPINAVMGMNEIILRESLQARENLPENKDAVRKIFADISDYSGVIGTAGKNLLSIINDILDISRIEAGRMEIRESEYSLSSVLYDVCSLIRFRAQTRNLVFLADVSEQIPDHLFGDGIRIRQILLNLLNNAVKYTVHGSVTLSVTGETDSSGILSLVFAVRDTGIGIRPEDRDRLFEKFERIGQVEDGSVEGTGLGLAIVKSLLDMMGGSIEVDSVYGTGSVFTATLPQKIVSDEPIGDFREKFENSAENAPPSRESFRAPEARILVVDDTRMNLTVVEGLLKSTEIRIDSVLSGADALRRTLSDSYDLILMDQRMPEMDGTEALRLIRSQETGLNRETPVICLTADAIAGAREKYIAEGFTDYLTKPVNSQALQKMLMRCLPREKLIPVVQNEPEENASAADRFAPLQEAGIDVSQGLSFCQQDDALYSSVLWEFACSAGKNADSLQRYLDAEDWKSYAITVHALKSTSATIGAARLSETAMRLEHAARGEDAETVHREHTGLIALYRRTADAVLSSVCRDGPAGPEEDSGILEFLPDE